MTSFASLRYNDQQLPTEILREMFEKRFWANVNKTEGCWLWTGASNGSGYGQIYFDGRYQGVHRFAWSLQTNEWPRLPKLAVLHHCDVKKCVRPDHLWLGTQKDNIQDAIRKGRWKPRGRQKIYANATERARAWRARKRGLTFGKIGRKRIYATDADRVRAWRQRRKEQRQ